MTETHTARDAPSNHHAESGQLITPSIASTVKPRKALLNRFITLSNAEVEEEDMRAELQYTQKRGILYTELDSQKKEIQRLVASHCGFACPDPVQVPKMVEQVNNKLMWLHGSFNVCIPVHINNSGQSLPEKMAFRVPLP
ncbi:hypothetical protein I7I51_06263 [Histoplasma capsulatum]|uniref:Uncharacterized protein n=1 Tax=Ajellomyces capsulatus TaxID=5037 RepID=A0A8A1MJX2_AJECA|nr:hypothetical protein I7I51_06263 [Histoplasma capsulatum]